MPPARPAIHAQPGLITRRCARRTSVNSPYARTKRPRRTMPAARGRLTSSVTPSALPTKIIGTRRVHSARSAILRGTKCVASGMVTSAAPKPVMPKTSAPRNAMPERRKTSAASVRRWSDLHAGIQRVAAADLGRAQRVSLDRLQHVGGGELALHRALVEVDGEQREDVAVRDLVVPRRARPVVAEVVARHVLVVCEPGGVVVQALTRAARRGR